MKTKKIVAVTIDKDVLSFTRKSAEKNKQNLSDYIEGLLEQEMLQNIKGD
jgi:ABC-type Zn2+ transport system substrate-binding protein/surface adhesin